MDKKLLEIKQEFFQFMENNHKELWDKYQHYVDVPTHEVRSLEIYDKSAKHKIEEELNLFFSIVKEEYEKIRNK